MTILLCLGKVAPSLKGGNASIVACRAVVAVVHVRWYCNATGGFCSRVAGGTVGYIQAKQGTGRTGREGSAGRNRRKT